MDTCRISRLCGRTDFREWEQSVFERVEITDWFWKRIKRYCYGQLLEVSSKLELLENERISFKQIWGWFVEVWYVDSVVLLVSRSNSLHFQELGGACATHFPVLSHVVLREVSQQADHRHAQNHPPLWRHHGLWNAARHSRSVCATQSLLDADQISVFVCVLSAITLNFVLFCFVYVRFVFMCSTYY